MCKDKYQMFFSNIIAANLYNYWNHFIFDLSSLNNSIFNSILFLNSFSENTSYAMKASNLNKNVKMQAIG